MSEYRLDALNLVDYEGMGEMSFQANFQAMFRFNMGRYPH